MINLAATDTLQGNAQTNSTVTVTVSGMELVGTTETYKKLYQGQPTTSVASLYSPAASTTGFIRSVHVVNTAASTQTFALYVSGAAGTNRITPDITLAANGLATYESDGWRVYNASGQLLSSFPLGTQTPAITDASAGSAGTSTLASPQDHDHQLSVATNALVLGTAAAPGAATSTLRSDDTIAAFDATVPTTSAVGDAAATGSVAKAARRDHAHGREAFGSTAQAVGTSAGGSATTPSKSDHVHATGAGTPSTQAFGDAAATGAGPAASMTDHKHAMPANPVPAFATPVATTPAAVSATGAASTIVRSDHGHQAVGGVAAIIATPATFAVDTIVDKFQFPANFFQAGTTLHVMARGTISATAAGQILGRIRIGTAGTTSDTQVCATIAVGAIIAAVGWFFDGYVTIRTTGSGGTCVGNSDMTINGTASILTTQSATVAVNTTVANFVDISITPSGTTPVCTVLNTLVEVVKT